MPPSLRIKTLRLLLRDTFPFTSPLITGYRNVRHLKHNWYSTVQKTDLSSPSPTLHSIRIYSRDGNQIRAQVDMARGEGITKDLARNAPLLTSLLRVHRIRVEKLSEGTAQITVTFQPQRKHWKPLQLPQTQTTGNGEGNGNNGSAQGTKYDLEQIPIYLDDSKRGAILGTKSLLIGGESESGKSNLTWVILDRLNRLRIPYRLWVIDPAGGVELADLEHSPLTRQYVDRPKDADKLVKLFHDSMDRRLRKMKSRGQRRHFPTWDEPLEICLIDELLLVKLVLGADDVTSPAGEILAVGRKALHIMIACSQLGQKESIGAIRDLFPQRICLRTKSRDATDAVLGSGATDDGAACHRISRPGEGYVYTDTSEGFEKIEVPLIQDTQRVSFPPHVPTLTRQEKEEADGFDPDKPSI